jgi:flavin reductase (DIM6/NTAB) family NADH-FMN oxidoreductase RutF
MQNECDVLKAWERKYPEQVVLVITKNKAGRINAMAVGWISIVSDEPAMFQVGIDDNAYTLELIRETKEFTIAYPSKEMAKEVLYFGTTHGHNEDKAKNSKLAFIPAKKIDGALLEDAVANFECKLVTEYRPGNCPLVVGQVVASYVNSNENLLRLVNMGPGYQLG